MATEDQKARAFHDAVVGQRWSSEELKYTSEGNLAQACFDAGYVLAATPAPASDAVLSELEEMERQATPAPWTQWVEQGVIFYGNPTINEPGHYSPANTRLFQADDYDREEEQEEDETSITFGTAADDAAFVAALRNAAPALLARVRAAEAKVATQQGALESSVQTNTVLAKRLLLIADRLPLFINWLRLAEEEADKEGENDGYEALYNAADKVGSGLRTLLREANGGKEATGC